MPHRSRISTVLIDIPEARFDDTARFWEAALGRTLGDLDHPRYRTLGAPGPATPDVALQRVEPEERGVHFDVETDDLEAEVQRLEALGARRKRQVKDWWVMEDPAGQAFCVVPVHSVAWPAGAVEWP